MFAELFRNALVCCFDGDDDGGGGDGNNQPNGDHSGDNTKVLTLTQDELNKMMAENKRATKQELEQKTAALQKTEKMYQTLLEKQGLSEKERTDLEASLEMIRGELRTKEETAKIEKKRLEDQLTGRIKEWEDKYSALDSKYRNESIRRAWQDALGNDAHNTKLTIDLMAPTTKFVEVPDESGKLTTKLVVELQDQDADGNPMVSTFTPAEAVKRMKELPDLYGGLFKSNLVSGVGGSNHTNSAIGGNGEVDLKKLAQNPAQFRELMKKRPELFGLRR